MKEKGLKNLDKILTGFVFIFFIFTALYKITEASLWLDEGVEYWYSKYLIGQLPYSDQVSTMYQNILKTYQPPLYNFLMYFWLRISDSVFWFRFFGVICGIVGAAGIFKSVLYISGSCWKAAAAVLMCGCTYRMIWYWQEAAEYCLMAGSLCWTIYFWLRLTDDPSSRNIICFVVSAIIPVYSQYGTILPVAALALTALLILVMGEGKKIAAIRNYILTCSAALLLAGLPLYFLFFRKQIHTLMSYTGPASILRVFSQNPVRETINGLRTVLKWIIFPISSQKILEALMIGAAVIILILLIKGQRSVKWLLAVNILTWAIYYFAVKCGYYARGIFGSRYDLFFIPLWIITAFAGIHDLLRMFRSKTIRCLTALITIIGLFYYGHAGLETIIRTPRIKENNKLIAEKWFEEGGPQTSTFVYYGAAPAFSCYLHLSDTFDETAAQNIVYMPWYENQTEEFYREYLGKIYRDALPPEILLAASHMNAKNDLALILDAFSDMGYSSTNLLDNNGKLLRLIRE